MDQKRILQKIKASWPHFHIGRMLGVGCSNMHCVWVPNFGTDGCVQTNWLPRLPPNPMGFCHPGDPTHTSRRSKKLSRNEAIASMRRSKRDFERCRASGIPSNGPATAFLLLQYQFAPLISRLPSSWVFESPALRDHRTRQSRQRPRPVVPRGPPRRTRIR